MVLVVSRFKVESGLEGMVRQAFRDRPRLADHVPGFLGMEVFTDADKPRKRAERFLAAEHATTRILTEYARDACLIGVDLPPARSDAGMTTGLVEGCRTPRTSVW